MEYVVKHLTNKDVRSGLSLRELRGIVIHWTANVSKGADAMAHYKYFENLKTRKASAHIVVDDERAVELIPLNEVAYHVGDHVRKGEYPIRDKVLFGERDPKKTLPNFYTIGIEICVNEDGDFEQALSNAAKVVVEILGKTNLDYKQVYRHYDITGKGCPRMFLDTEVDGKRFNFAFKAFLALVRQRLNTNYQKDLLRSHRKNIETLQEINEALKNQIKEMKQEQDTKYFFTQWLSSLFKTK